MTSRQQVIDNKNRPLLVRSAKSASGKTPKNSKTGKQSYKFKAVCIINASHSDEYCPHCDNHYILEAKTPQAVLKVDGEDVRKDARMLKDERLKAEEPRTMFDLKDAADRLI